MEGGDSIRNVDSTSLKSVRSSRNKVISCSVFSKIDALCVVFKMLRTLWNNGGISVVRIRTILYDKLSVWVITVCLA